MSFGVWWCNYTDMKSYRFEKEFNTEKINELEYKLERCAKDEKDCDDLKKSLQLYQKRLEIANSKSEIAEKKCKLWDEIQKLDKEERSLS